MKEVQYGAQEVDGIRLVNELERSVFTKFPVLGLWKMWLLRQKGCALP